MLMRISNRLKARKAGFTLIELAIVLAVTSLLTAGLWRMMSSGNTQLRDQAAADKHRELIIAVRNYLSSGEGDTFAKSGVLTDGSVVTISLAGLPGATVPAEFRNFLSEEFRNNATNSYGQRYQIAVRRQVDGAGTYKGYTFMVLTTGGEDIPDTSGGRISSMIGNDGGFIYSNAVCGAAGLACGAFGTWSTSSATYNLAASWAGGHIASRSTFVGAGTELNPPWLAREPQVQHDSDGDGIDDWNTFGTTTETALNGSIIWGGVKNGTWGGSILNVQEMTLGRTATNGSAPLQIENESGCSKASPSAADCDYMVEVTGDMGITGLLTANRLYAAQFIYDTSGMSSDIRLKHDIQKLEDVLGKLSMIQGYSFLMNNGGQKRYGVIAQEVEKVFPELVNADEKGMKNVDYIGLIGPLVSAVNSLREENAKLKQTIEQQGKTLDAIRQKIK